MEDRVMGTKQTLDGAVNEEHDETSDAMQRIKAALHGLRYGAVTALVQDGVVVLVERTEKMRLERRERSV
jgi:hypothetical protein